MSQAAWSWRSLVILADEGSSSSWYGLARCSNHWRLRGYAAGVGERGCACAAWRVSRSRQACERSLVYCLRILRFSCFFWGVS